MDRLFSFSCLVLVGYLIIMFSVMFTLPPEELKLFLKSSRDFVLDIPLVFERFINTIGQFIVNTIGQFIVNTIGQFLTGLVLVISSFLESLFSYRLIFVIIGFLSAEFLMGWIYSRDEMKAMVRAVVDEGKLICPPLPDALSKIWDVLSNPWKLILLAVFISFVRLQPALWIHILKAAEKSI